MFEEILPNQKIRLWQWMAIPIFVAVGYLGLVLNWFGVSFLWLPVMESIGLFVVYGWKNFKRFFKFPKTTDFGYIFKMIFLAFGLAILAVIIGRILGLNFNANPIFNYDKKAILINLLFIWISLLGEELIVAMVALPIYGVAVKRTSTKNAWWIALIISSVFFGALHIPTYGWNFYHAIVVIGLTRIPFSMAWKRTDSLMGGILAHIIYDYGLILFVLLVR